MVELTSLWLPMVLSGAALFIVSFFAWTVLPHHKKDWIKLPDEDGFQSAVRDLNLSPGNYSFPFCEGHEDMKSEEFKRRFAEGPSGTISVWSGPPQMGKNMVCTFLFFLAASFCLAYLATLGVAPGAEFMRVFRFIGTAGILTYSAAGIPNAIWFQQKILGNVLDGVAYGLITGLIFAAMWPGGPVL